MDLGLLVRPPLPSVHHAVLDLPWPPHAWDGDPVREGPVPLVALATLIMSSSPEGKFALDSPAGGRAMCIYVHTQCLSPAPSISPPLHGAGRGKGPCPSGLNPPRFTPPLPAALLARDPRPGASRQKAGVGFALFYSLDSTSLLHHFPLAPVGVRGLGKGTDLCSYFHTFPVQNGAGGSRPSP